MSVNWYWPGEISVGVPAKVHWLKGFERSAVVQTLHDIAGSLVKLNWNMPFGSFIVSVSTMGGGKVVTNILSAMKITP